MYTHMKTTIDISDSLMTEAKALAAREGTTLRSLVEAGLRDQLKQRKSGPRFVLRKASVPGGGTQEGVEEGEWDVIRNLAYEGRGA